MFMVLTLHLIFGEGVIQEVFHEEEEEEELLELGRVGDTWAKKGRDSVWVKRINLLSTCFILDLPALGSRGEGDSPALKEHS